MTDHSVQFKQWMSWKQNELLLGEAVRQEEYIVFDHTCDELGISDLIRRRNTVRFKNKEDMAFIKLKFKNLTANKNTK